MKKIIYVFVLLVFASFVFADSYGFNNVQYTNPSFTNYYSSSDISTYWPKLSEQFENDQCEATTDFMVTILPGSCSPAVVRSDLLEEQNVPVFCQLSAVQLNPLIDVSSIKSVSFKGSYPAEVAGISFHPAKAALRSYNSLLNSPTLNNIGYVVIVLKKQKNESVMVENVSGTLTATISYDAKNAFGVGSSEFYLEAMEDYDWLVNKNYYSFWNGRGFLRLDEVNANEATISVMTQDEAVIRRFSLKVGETSSKFYFPGFYCQAGMRVKLNSFSIPEDSVLLNIDGTEVWARKDSRIVDGYCRVLSVNIASGETGTVRISCGGKSFDLRLGNEYFVNLSLNSSRLFQVGDVVNKNLYVAYIGMTRNDLISGVVPGTGFVVLINSTNEIDSSLYSEVTSKIRNIFEGKVALTEDEFKKKIRPSRVKEKDFLVYFDKGKDGDINEILSSREERRIVAGTTVESSAYEKYFSNGSETVLNLLDTYPNTGTGGYVYAEQALLSQIQAIGEIYGDRFERVELLNLFLEKYPNSEYIGWVKNELAKSQTVNSENAYKTVYAGNKYVSIGVVKFKAQNPMDKSFQMFLGNKLATSNAGTTSIFEGDIVNLSRLDNNEVNDYLVVKEIKINRIDFDMYVNNNTGASVLKTSFSLPYNSNIDADQQVREIDKGIDGNAKYKLSIVDLDVKRTADVSIVTEMKSSSEANFSFNIGIEKRAIKLSPEKANETADALNKTIKEWEEKNEKLGKVVEAWKGACLATGLGLQIKSFLTGFNGEGIARPKVMDIYQAKCRAEKPDETLDVCYNHFSDDISKDIDVYAGAIKAINGEIDGINLESWKKDNCSGEIIFAGDKTVSCDSLNSWEDARSYLLYEKLKNELISPELNDSLRTDMESKLNKVLDLFESSRELSEMSNRVPSEFKESVTYVQDNNVKDYSISYYKTVNVGVLRDKITDSSPVSRIMDILYNRSENIGLSTIRFGMEDKIVLIQNRQGGSPFAVATYNVTISEGKYIIKGEDNDFTKKVAIVAGQKCAFPYRKNMAFARFYETEPNRGMPSIVPFDLEDGWYAYVPQSAGGAFSQDQSGYQESGMASFFYVCNVGPNGIENMRGGDDICQSFNSNNYANVKEFGGCSLSVTEVQNLARKAERAIRDAASQYQSGKRQTITTIDGKFATVEPASSGSSDLTQCQDFMSPEDCKLLFNVCDPVICPSSRCDFGGKYPVANVIQSGIVGSLLLCLPNSVLNKGDVYIPICLTGVHAGIEGWISILKAEQNCLREYVKSGKHTGICDEMTAVYKCEFFWRQVQPLIQGIVPNLVEFVYTGGEKGFNKKGGGEYATFQTAWDNMGKSMDFFTNNYAQTSFTAFKFGDFATTGSEFCKSFIGTTYPTSADALDAMLKPESPPQFFGKFSEIKMSDATIPATSQYKVFFHIYAGTDRGATYRVYLKSPPSNSYYQTAPTVHVKSGYIVSGEQASESVDFSAPAGYKELCLVINNEEQCGFTAVSTDFAVNLVHDKYVEEQADKTVSTEKECISGSASVWALVNTNLQEGADEFANPSIDLRGIVRVCASENPGASSNPSRWKNIGNCGSNNLICWQDQNSVNRDALNLVSATGSIDSAVQTFDNKNYGDIMTSEESLEKLAALKSAVRGLDRVGSPVDKINLIYNNATDIITRGMFDSNRAEAMQWLAEAYWKVLNFLVVNDGKRDSVIPTAPTDSVSESNEGGSDSRVSLNEIGKDRFEILYDGNKIGEIKKTGASWMAYDLSTGKIPIVLNRRITVLSKANLEEIDGCEFNGTNIIC